MRTTIDIPDELMAQAMAVSGCRTKREAVVEALNELVRRKMLDEMRTWFGHYDYGMTNEELEAAFPDE